MLQTCPAPRASSLRPPVRAPRCHCTVSAACREAQPAGRQAPPLPPQGPSLLERLRGIALAGALSATLCLAPMAPGAMEAHAQSSAVISNDTPVVDLARVVPAGRLEGLQQQLRDLERWVEPPQWPG